MLASGVAGMLGWAVPDAYAQRGFDEPSATGSNASAADTSVIATATRARAPGHDSFATGARALAAGVNSAALGTGAWAAG
ncbi:hypothetical protein B1M_06995, partial [Burkholderia sp. TJI49]